MGHIGPQWHVQVKHREWIEVGAFCQALWSMFYILLVYLTLVMSLFTPSGNGIHVVDSPRRKQEFRDIRWVTRGHIVGEILEPELEPEFHLDIAWCILSLGKQVVQVCALFFGWLKYWTVSFYQEFLMKCIRHRSLRCRDLGPDSSAWPSQYYGVPPTVCLGSIWPFREKSSLWKILPPLYALSM